MYAVVDRETCIGCELCASNCPEVFYMVEGKAEGGEVPAVREDCARQMVEDCPVAAISVTEKARVEAD